LIAFANDVTPEQIAENFGIKRATAMRRMCKLEKAGKIIVVLTCSAGGYIGSGNGHNNLSYCRPESKA
jgi:predicted ArsR family transcriptional regulator